MQPWLDRVPAVFQVWYPGQEGGRALAELVFGEANPSGRLPVTFERRWDDNPTHDSYYPEAGTNRVVYREGLFMGYRGYAHNGTKPLFPFGYGLSYTTFAYGNLSVSGPLNDHQPWQVQVQFDVTNTGKREGQDVAQVYVGKKDSSVPRPAKQLKGFEKIALRRHLDAGPPGVLLLRRGYQAVARRSRRVRSLRRTVCGSHRTRG
jgi:beta-glucosidase